jgi:hypothetical protein
VQQVNAAENIQDKLDKLMDNTCDIQLDAKLSAQTGNHKECQHQEECRINNVLRTLHDEHNDTENENHTDSDRQIIDIQNKINALTNILTDRCTNAGQIHNFHLPFHKKQMRLRVSIQKT